MNKITFIAQFPPPVHGLSKAVDTLYRSLLGTKYFFKKVDIKNNKSIIKNLIRILFSKDDLYYFTISQTKGGNWRDLLILNLLRLKRVKHIIHLHGGYYRVLIDRDCGRFQRMLNYKAISKADGCIVLGKSLKYIFEGLINNDKIYVVSNCVDDEFTPYANQSNSKLMEFRNEDFPLNVLFLSNFIESKGYKDVLELALKTKNNKGHFHFHFAGKFFKKIEEDYFFSYIEKNDLSDFVTYHGIVSGKEKSNLLNICHIFILLTRYPNEGQPISILEAMGNGMTIITTNHAGIPDIVEDTSNGLVVDKEKIDLDDIYNYILALSANRERLVNISKNNYLKVRSYFSENQYIEDMDKIFTFFTQSK